MFYRIPTLLVVLYSLFFLAAANTPTTTVIASPSTQTSIPASQCNTGETQCCKSVDEAGSTVVAALLNTLGVVVDSVEALVGITCTPISVIGIGQTACTDKPVCCANNNFNGVIAIGCVPITVNI